jgi:hypothetical protein
MTPYWAKTKVCNACLLKAQFTTSSRGRRLSRHVDEGVPVANGQESTLDMSL